MSLGFSPLSGNALADSGGSAAATTLFIASGISPLSVGTPSASAAANPIGFSSTQIGSPAAAMSGVYFAEGVAPTTAFGTPATESPAFAIYGTPTYVRDTHFGKPSRLVYNFVPSASNGAKIGTPKANTTRYTCAVTGITPATWVGLPVGGSRVFGDGASIDTTRIGTPFCRYTQYGAIHGINTTQVGRPRNRLPIPNALWFVTKQTPRLTVWTDGL